MPHERRLYRVPPLDPDAIVELRAERQNNPINSDEEVANEDLYVTRYNRHLDAFKTRIGRFRQLYNPITDEDEEMFTSVMMSSFLDALLHSGFRPSVLREDRKQMLVELIQQYSDVHGLDQYVPATSSSSDTEIEDLINEINEEIRGLPSQRMFHNPSR